MHMHEFHYYYNYVILDLPVLCQMLGMCAYESIHIVSIDHENHALLSMCSYQLAMPSNSLVVLVIV